jgi:MFS family permease
MRHEVDSPYAWFRLGVAMLISALGGVGMWSVVVALPAVQHAFGVERGEASLPYTLLTIGFGFGNVLMGRLSDRFGVVRPLLVGACSLGLGYILASISRTLWQFALVYGVLIGLFGIASTFAPLMADISKWFERRRGIAVALCASGSYVAGTIWPPFIAFMIRAHGWRAAHFWIGIICVTLMIPLALLLRAPAPAPETTRRVGPSRPRRRFPQVTHVPPMVLQGLLAIAGFCCCVAMSTPQVHLVAYCGDLGYGVGAGARMLSVMLACGVISRIAYGFLADRLGGLPALVVSSFAQMAALSLYLTSSGLAPLYVISAIFGLSQGGLIPSYALVIRENYPAREVGGRVGVVMMMTMFGMAFGGWIAGAIFDMTGSYQAAFADGVAWNAVNFAILAFVLTRTRRPREAVA